MPEGTAPPVGINRYLGTYLPASLPSIGSPDWQPTFFKHQRKQTPTQIYTHATTTTPRHRVSNTPQRSERWARTPAQRWPGLGTDRPRQVQRCERQCDRGGGTRGCLRVSASTQRRSARADTSAQTDTPGRPSTTTTLCNARGRARCDDTHSRDGHRHSPPQAGPRWVGA